MYFKVIFYTAIFVIVAILYKNKVPCDLHNDICITKAAQDLIKMIAVGNPSWGIETSDPLHRDRIDASMSYMNYTVTNANLHGFKDCNVDILKFMENSSWYLYLICPRLTLKSNYEVIGEISSIFIEGKGKVQIIHDDYHVGINGNYETVTGADFKPHINIKTYEIDVLDVKGIVVYKLSNLFYGDEEKSEKAHKLINENWKAMSDGTHHPAMHSFMGKLIENINKFFTILPIKEMFYTKELEL